jgi:hypothetical protein
LLLQRRWRPLSRTPGSGDGHYLRDHLPDVRSIILPRTEWGHFGRLEQPEVIVEHLLENLAPASTPASGLLGVCHSRAGVTGKEETLWKPS